MHSKQKKIEGNNWPRKQLAKAQKVKEEYRHQQEQQELAKAEKAKAIT